MSAIKDFFKKKKVDAKFKVAGGGHKLGDTSTSGSANAAAAAAAARASAPVPSRQHPSSSSQQAGAAALNRLAGGGSGIASDSDEFKKSRQRALIKEQARRELELEQEQQEKMSEMYRDPPASVVPEQDAPQQLAAQGVFFRCDLVDPSLVLPRDDMRECIREFLYAQLAVERGLTAVLIIHTCNSPRERVATAVETLCKYIENILQNPTEEKFRKIRRSNRAFSERVAALQGTTEFLEDCGFQVKTLANAEGVDEEFWVLDPEADFEHLSMLQDSLRSCQPLTAELDRGLTVIKPGSGTGSSIGALPTDFFTLSSDEIKKEQQDRQDVVEREMMLRTKAMREKEASAGRRKYKYCLVRVRFPDGHILQGTFSVYEPLSAVLQFVTNSLDMCLPFNLIDSSTGSRLLQEQSSLTELGLVPASLLNFSWDADMKDAPTTFLKSNLTS